MKSYYQSQKDAFDKRASRMGLSVNAPTQSELRNSGWTEDEIDALADKLHNERGNDLFNDVMNNGIFADTIVETDGNLQTVLNANNGEILYNIQDLGDGQKIYTDLNGNIVDSSKINDIDIKINGKDAIKKASEDELKTKELQEDEEDEHHGNKNNERDINWYWDEYQHFVSIVEQFDLEHYYMVYRNGSGYYVSADEQRDILLSILEDNFTPLYFDEDFDALEEWTNFMRANEEKLIQEIHNVYGVYYADIFEKSMAFLMYICSAGTYEYSVSKALSLGFASELKGNDEYDEFVEGYKKHKNG